MNNSQALCESASKLLARITPDYSITPDDRPTIETLCMSYINLCEAQRLATERADRLQAKSDIIEGERESFRHLAEWRKVELEQAQNEVNRLQIYADQAHEANRALLAGEA